jgi:oxygen-dependent protoporphyrinogen oxidase
MSVGAHMFPGSASVVGKLIEAYGLEVLPITGSLLNIALGGRLVRGSRPELLPFRLPLPPLARASFAWTGLRVKRSAEAYMRAIRPRPGDTDASIRLRGLQFEGDTSFAAWAGRTHPAAMRVFAAIANRSVSDPETISQSGMASMFGHVFEAGDLGRNLRGGAALLTDALGADLARYVRLETRVTSVRPDGAGVRVTCQGPDGAAAVRARTAIVAVPTPQIAGLLGDAADPDLAAALACVRFGPFVVLSIRTDETEPMPWDGLYSVLTPDASFNMFFNHANAVIAAGAPKQGSVLMVYGGGSRGRALLGRSEDEVREIFLRDLDALFPQIRPRIVETWVKPWAEAGPFPAPGRWRAQAALERGLADRIFLAGDGISEFASMDTAARTARDVATRARAAATR